MSTFWGDVYGQLFVINWDFVYRDDVRSRVCLIKCGESTRLCQDVVSQITERAEELCHFYTRCFDVTKEVVQEVVRVSEIIGKKIKHHGVMLKNLKL